MKLDTVCFGALNLDKLYTVNNVAIGGEESFILNCRETPGGSAANTAIGLAKLKTKTGFIGKISQDREGKIQMQNFTQEKVDTSGIITSPKGRSGTVLGFIDKRGERALYIDPGVNDTLSFEEIDDIYAKSANFLHLTSYVGTKPFNAQKKLVKSLPDVKISFDPGTLYAHKGLPQLKPIIKRSFVILPNQYELKIITEKEDYKQGAKVLIEEGSQIVAVKLGAKGCYVTDGEENFHVQPLKVKVKDTTGAGDAFCAGFLFGLLKKKNLYDCGNIGNFMASRCIEEVGARENLPTLTELDKWLKQT